MMLHRRRLPSFAPPLGSPTLEPPRRRRPPIGRSRSRPTYARRCSRCHKGRRTALRDPVAHPPPSLRQQEGLVVLVATPASALPQPLPVPPSRTSRTNYRPSLRPFLLCLRHRLHPRPPLAPSGQQGRDVRSAALNDRGVTAQGAPSGHIRTQGSIRRQRARGRPTRHPPGRVSRGQDARREQPTLDSLILRVGWTPPWTSGDSHARDRQGTTAISCGGSSCISPMPRLSCTPRTTLYPHARPRRIPTTTLYAIGTPSSYRRGSWSAARGPACQRPRREPPVPSPTSPPTLSRLHPAPWAQPRGFAAA